MSADNTTETAALDMFLRGTDPSYRAGATQYLALFTADPGETASLAAEATYTGYARVALTKSSAWTGTSSPFTNAALIQFGANLPMAAIADEAERWLGKPVIPVNTATYWHALRSEGIDDRMDGHTALLSRF